jgi:seryl-tRNA synthetase
MLDIRTIIENPDFVKEIIQKKKESGDVDRIIALYNERRSQITEVEELKALRNKVSEEIGAMKKKGEDASQRIAEMKEVSSRIKDFDRELSEKSAMLEELMLEIPNLPHESAPPGLTAAENRVVREWGQDKEQDFKVKDHLTFGTELGIFDFKRGAKISGTGFPLLSGWGAMLDRALINHFIAMATNKLGYKEVAPPLLLNRQSAMGTGQLPKAGDQMYFIEKDGFYLVPTAEVPLTNMFRDEILDQQKLPINIAAYSPCFRREAGTWGKDTRGFTRLHQFNKVELVKICRSEDSLDQLESLVKDAEAILQSLELKYRVVELCVGDLSFAAAKCYDIEVWAPAEGKWLEVSSCSNCWDFQARRINIRYRDQESKKPRFAHTLNGSGLATPRLLVALLETFQTADGKFTVPRSLQPFMEGQTCLG